MDFATWTRALSVRGLQVVPPSHPVPVVVWALQNDGGALYFRCRGTSVWLAEFTEADVVLVEPGSLCGCGCGLTARAPDAPPRLTIRAGALPFRETRFDGAEAEGWTGHEAGLLRVRDAAALFDRLLAELHAMTAAPLPRKPAVP